MADIKIEDLGFESCEPTGSLQVDIHYAPTRYFESIPEPKKMCGSGDKVAQNFAELATITEQFKFKEGKGFHKLGFVPETGEITSGLIGEKFRRLIENSLVGQMEGSYAELLGFCRWVKNQKLIILFKEFSSDNVRVIGSGKMPGWIEALEHKIEATAEGNNSLSLTFKDKNFSPAPIYKGDIVLFPETAPKG